jgi:uncharacterized small protein (DUF1192 family)
MTDITDEIERLSAEHTDKAKAWDAIAEKNAEIERLYSELEQVVRERETYNAFHQVAVMEIECLRSELDKARDIMCRLISLERGSGEQALAWLREQSGAAKAGEE